MPRLHPPADSLPFGANRAHRAIAATTRLEVIRYLLAHPYRTSPQIQKATGLHKETVREALNELDTLGYLLTTAETPRGQRRGTSPGYMIKAHLFLPDLDSLTAYIASR